MDLQNLFYLIGLIFMIVAIAATIFVGYIIFSVLRFLKKTPQKANSIIEGIVSSRKNQFIGMIIASVTSLIFSKLKNRMK